jgi:polyisoprenoid-binding protein YceI
MPTTTLSPLRRVLLAGGAGVVLGATALGVGAYSYLKPTAAASAPIQTIPLTVNTTQLAADASDTTQGTTLYEIDSDASQASFVIDEVLNGSPKTVVGTTNQVAGQLALDPADPSAAQLGTIWITAGCRQCR